MCGLCGILAGELHWAERTAGAQANVSPRAERLGRITYLNRLLKAYACTVADWHGAAYVLSTYTGKTEIASDLADLEGLAHRVGIPVLDGKNIFRLPDTVRRAVRARKARERAQSSRGRR